jgi:hypothetical protein
MRLSHAVIAGLVLGGGAGWWAIGHPGYETAEQQTARVEAQQAARKAEEPKIYRWRDGNGVLHITDKPPSGRKYELIEPREDINVIPMSVPEPESEAKK